MRELWHIWRGLEKSLDECDAQDRKEAEADRQDLTADCLAAAHATAKQLSHFWPQCQAAERLAAKHMSEESFLVNKSATQSMDPFPP